MDTNIIVGNTYKRIVINGMYIKIVIDRGEKCSYMKTIADHLYMDNIVITIYIGFIIN